MQPDINWKLISFVSIPAGLISGWVFGQGLSRFLKYVLLIVILSVVGLMVYKISEKSRKSNMFNAIILTIAVTLLMHFLRQI
jgi:hypothetical protein|tara:strand:- start:146 stop:391 length:246 start_codon:yes stop_codon:yes gene_type:complete